MCQGTKAVECYQGDRAGEGGSVAVHAEFDGADADRAIAVFGAAACVGCSVWVEDEDVAVDGGYCVGSGHGEVSVWWVLGGCVYG